MNTNTEITVALPTIGRMEMLKSCLSTLAKSTLIPAEVLLLDQSGDSKVEQLPEVFPEMNIRVVPCVGKGIARNMNLALRSCNTDHMLVTHDDCTVASDWVEMGVTTLAGRRHHIVTGRVKPGGNDPLAVPSTRDSPDRYDFTGTLTHGALYPNNMGIDVAAALEIGGFDERNGFLTAAEDLDFSYRWLKNEFSMVYEPSMVVTHNDWRGPNQLLKLHKHYARCAGRYYGKHLYLGDYVPFRQGIRDIKAGIRAMARCRLHKIPRYHDERCALPLWVPVGIVEGLVESLRIDRRHKQGFHK